MGRALLTSVLLLASSCALPSERTARLLDSMVPFHRDRRDELVGYYVDEDFVQWCLWRDAGWRWCRDPAP